MTDRRSQAVTGLIPPELDEAVIRVVWPSVAAMPAIATLGRVLIRSFILAPLGWFVMIGPYFLKVLPGLGRRYVLTNRRLMLQRGVSGKPSAEVPLSEIEDVRVHEDSNSSFFRAANLEVLAKGKVAMTLPGVPGPESFRHAILDACRAWAPEHVVKAPFLAASASKPA
jgi:hypothetical protein